MAIEKRKMSVAVSQALVCWGLVAGFAPGWARAAEPPVTQDPPSATADATLAQATSAPAPAPVAAAPAPSPAPGAPATSDNTVESVVVTAQSRTQTAQSVPISMQVITTDQISKLQAVNLGSMNGYIPGLQVDAHEPTQPEYTIRGITNSDFGIGTDAPIGVYVDGAYTGKTGGALLNFNDVQRIEVLDGPQGTLFGRNSAGGAISVITNEPIHDFQADATVRIENYGTEYADGMLNVPLADHLAARLSFVTNQSEGWLKNQYNGQQYENADDWGTRLQFLWDGIPNTKVLLGWEHEILNQLPTPAIGIVTPPAFTPGVPNPNIFPNISPSLYTNPVNAPLNNDVVDGKESRSFDGVTLHITHDFANDTQLTSLTAYRHFDSLNRNDRDGTDQIWTYFDTANIESNTTLQQEFKLAGKTGIADWVTGVSYYLEHATQASQLNTYTDTLNTLFNNDAGLPLYSILQSGGLPVLGLPWQETMYNHGDYRAIAAYGDVIWHVTPDLSLTTGGRLTHDDKEFSWYEPDRAAPQLDGILASPQAQGFLNAISSGALVPLGIPPIPAAELNALLKQNVLLQTTGDIQAPYSTSASWTDFSPRVVLQYNLNRDAMVYGSVTRGYQAGGFNSVDVNSEYQPETVVNYEIGTKMVLRNYGLLFDASIFDYKFDHLQSLNLVAATNPLSPPTYQVVSTNQSARGLDLQTRWRPTHDLQLFFQSEYINQRYDSDVAPDGTVLTGQAVGTPLWTGAMGGDYYFRNVFGGTVDLTLQGTYTGPERCNSDVATTGLCLKTPAFDFGEATHRVDFRLGWDSQDRTWGVAFFVQNLLNNRYMSGLDLISATKLGTPAAQITAPRFFGLEMTMHL